MMVADDKIDAERGGIFYLFDSLDSAIQDYYQFHPRGMSLVDGFGRDAISLVISGGDIVLDVGVEILQVLVDQCDGSSAIDIIVAKHHDLLL